MTVVTAPDTINGGDRRADLSIQFLDNSNIQLALVTADATTVHPEDVPLQLGMPLGVASTYWQLETYNDWGVQFTGPETTTITNNTGSDATARFRITAPTAAASSSTSSGGSSIGAIYQTPVAGELFNTTDTQVKTITHTDDSSNLRSVYIEKQVPLVMIARVWYLPHAIDATLVIEPDVTQDD